jgi:hypothetical protein
MNLSYYSGKIIISNDHGTKQSQDGGGECTIGVTVDRRQRHGVEFLGSTKGYLLWVAKVRMSTVVV